MDTGKTIDNFKFYEGFEGEPEIVIKAENSDMQILILFLQSRYLLTILVISHAVMMLSFIRVNSLKNCVNYIISVLLKRTL